MYKLSLGRMKKLQCCVRQPKGRVPLKQETTSVDIESRANRLKPRSSIKRDVKFPGSQQEEEKGSLNSREFCLVSLRVLVYTTGLSCKLSWKSGPFFVAAITPARITQSPNHSVSLRRSLAYRVNNGFSSFKIWSSSTFSR